MLYGIMEDEDEGDGDTGGSRVWPSTKWANREDRQQKQYLGKVNEKQVDD